MKYYLAPLADYTDAAFRKLCFAGGADRAYTEMVSAAALFHENDARKVGAPQKTRHMLEKLPGEGDLVAQTFGSKEDELAYAAREISKLDRFIGLDLNAGCPMPRIIRNGEGAALCADPEKTFRCLKAMKAETTLPLSLKTRPGPRPDKVLMMELLAAAQEAGCAEVTLHARFTSQMHGGDVHLDLLAEFVQAARIPVIGNGSVRDVDAATRMAETGVAAIMVGRGALGNPGVFNELKGLEGMSRKEAFENHVVNLLELQAQIERNFPGEITPSPDAIVAQRLHTQLYRYFKGLPGAGELRRRLSEIRTLREICGLASLFTPA